MKFGARFLGWWYNSANDLLEWGKLSEDSGFDFCWYSHDVMFRNTWTLEAILASQTRRITIPTYTNPYSVSPGEAATLVATLDEVSQGRAVLCVGGHTTEMIKWMGTYATDPIQRTREMIEIVRRCLRSYTTRSFDVFDGKDFHWKKEAYLRFQPRRESVPIYISPHSEEHLLLAGELADGVYPMVTPPEAARSVVDPVLEGCRRASRSPEAVDIAGFAWVSISKGDSKAAADLLRPFVAYFGPYLPEKHLNLLGLSQSDFAEIRRQVDRGRIDLAIESLTPNMLRLGIAGTISECSEHIAALEKAGITQISLGGPFGPDVPEAIRAIGSEIIPSFQVKNAE